MGKNRQSLKKKVAPKIRRSRNKKLEKRLRDGRARRVANLILEDGASYRVKNPYSGFPFQVNEVVTVVEQYWVSGSSYDNTPGYAHVTFRRADGEEVGWRADMGPAMANNYFERLSP